MHKGHHQNRDQEQPTLPRLPPTPNSTDDPILRAAAHFYRRGIGNVSIQDIRQLAGVSLKALYARYPSESLVT